MELRINRVRINCSRPVLYLHGSTSLVCVCVYVFFPVSAKEIQSFSSAMKRTEFHGKQGDLYVNRVFRTLYKVDRNGNFVFKGFNNSKKKMS